MSELIQTLSRHLPSHQIIVDELRRLAYGRLRWANKLLSGAWRWRFSLAYQPVVCLRTGENGVVSANSGLTWSGIRSVR